VEEFHNYPADWPKLRELLAALAKARIVEPKTSNPEYFSRLGVGDVTDPESRATLLRLQGDDAQMAVLVGNSAEGRDGHYVRLEGGERALLIDQALSLPVDAKDWLQRDIVNISDAEVVEFSVKHADGEEIGASRASADDDDFTLQSIPDGREVLSSWSVNSIANALSNLQLDAVAPADSVDFSAATQFRLLTADGLEVLAELADSEEQQWLRLSARVYAAPDTESEADEAATEAEAISEDAEPAEAAESAGTPSPVDPEALADAEIKATAPDRAAEINQRVQGWAYVIPAFKADTMNKRLEDLLKPLPEGE
jgi:hypothetical protein